MSLAYEWVDPVRIPPTFTGLDAREERLLNRAAFVVGMDRRTLLGQHGPWDRSRRRVAVMLCLHEVGMSDHRLAHLFGWDRRSVPCVFARHRCNPVVVQWCEAIRAFAEETGGGW